MSTLLKDISELKAVIGAGAFSSANAEDEELEKLDKKLACVVVFLEKYQMIDFQHECALVRYYLSSKDNATNSTNKYHRMLDVADSFQNHGFAIIAMRLFQCVNALNNNANPIITARGHYVEGVGFSSLDNELYAIKRLYKAENIVLSLEETDYKLLSKVYYALGAAYGSHPIKWKQKKSMDFINRTIQIKKEQLETPFEIIFDYYRKTLSAEESVGSIDELRVLSEYITENSYSKHFFLSHVYGSLAYRLKKLNGINSEVMNFYGRASDIHLNKYYINKNLTSLTMICLSLGQYNFILEDYPLAITFFEVSESLYKGWEEIDSNDLVTIYEYIWNCYLKIGDESKAKKYLKLAKEHSSGKKDFATVTQFLNINSDTVAEYLKTLVITSVHKAGYSLSALNEYISSLFKRIFDAVDLMEKSVTTVRSFEECCAEILFESARVLRGNDFNLAPEYDFSERLFRQSADMGSYKAKFAIMSLIDKEYDDREKLYNFLLSSYNQGDVLAGYTLGRMSKDIQERVRFFSVAAEYGDAPSQYQLGLIYRDGIGVPRDIDSAVALWKEAAEQNDLDALTEMGLIYNFDRVRFDLGDEPYDFSLIDRDTAKSIEYFTKAAKLGDARAQFMLGQFYWITPEIKNLSSVEFWLLKAADQDFPMAMLYLARLYASKENLSFFNFNDAVYWYDKTYETFSESDDKHERQIAESAKLSKELFVSHNFWHKNSKELTYESDKL